MMLLVPQFLRPGHVQERVGLAVEPQQLGLGHAVAAAAWVLAAEHPPAVEAVRRHVARVVRLAHSGSANGQLVASVVPDRVVHHLETIEVEEQDAELRART